jgi:hypothetical protein
MPRPYGLFNFVASDKRSIRPEETDLDLFTLEVGCNGINELLRGRAEYGARNGVFR